MITEQRICMICDTPFTAKAACYNDLRKTCCHKCASKLTTKNYNKNKRTVINGKDLSDYVHEHIKNNTGSTTPAYIIKLNPELKRYDTPQLRHKIGRILSSEFGYTKISQRAYQKL